MPSVNILRECKIIKSPRLMQMEGMFDVPPSEKSVEKWDISFDLPSEWNVGLIVGPSGCGKSTIAREIFGRYISAPYSWPDDKSILDGFPAGMSIKDIIALLSSVGFSSPPSWVRPFRVLSNGEQFRATVARTLAEMKDIALIDEFTSVVDRTVAQIGSAAIAKTVRRYKQRFIAVSCHYDIAEWLEPDWIYEPHLNKFTIGRLLRRPQIELEVFRVHRSAWQIFRKHHYLNTEIHRNAQCFVAIWKDRPVAMAAIMHFPHPCSRHIKREHRVVCLPDYQGVGIGNAVSEWTGSLCRGINHRYLSQTSHPAMIRYRNKSPKWRMIAKPNISSKTFSKQSFRGSGVSSSGGFARRYRATFEYIGPALDRYEALNIYSQ